MAEIIPIRAITYDPAAAGPMDALVAPPYDVIDSAEQDALYGRSEYNCIRLILNRAEPGDDPTTDPYARAAQAFRGWLSAGVLRERAHPALWVYRQVFSSPVDGSRHSRSGIVCGLGVEPYDRGVVLPHEETRSKAREDRLRLTRAMGANPEPIFGLYEDPDGVAERCIAQAQEALPSIEVHVGGDEHALWPIEDPDAADLLQHTLRNRRVWIADGHHRYETALRYRDERRAAGSPVGSGADYVLTVLTAFEDPGLLVFPTHRLVRGIAQDRLDGLDAGLREHFLLREVSRAALTAELEAVPENERAFGVLTPRGAAIAILTDAQAMGALAADHSPAWRDLDVSVLQTLALDHVLGIPASALATTPDVAYTRDAAHAAAAVASGECQVAFLLRKPHADDVRKVAAAGDKMPPKSTFFYPKLWSGLILRKLD